MVTWRLQRHEWKWHFSNLHRVHNNMKCRDNFYLDAFGYQRQGLSCSPGLASTRTQPSALVPIGATSRCPIIAHDLLSVASAVIGTGRSDACDDNRLDRQTRPRPSTATRSFIKRLQVVSSRTSVTSTLEHSHTQCLLHHSRRKSSRRAYQSLRLTARPSPTSCTVAYSATTRS